MRMDLPVEIAHIVGDANLQEDTIGESPCSVHCFVHGKDRFYLKSSPAIYASTTYSVRREAAVLAWLAGRLHVPELLAVAERDGTEFMITRAVPGVPLSACIEAGKPAVGLFGEALRQLQGMAIHDCPFDARIKTRLHELDYLMAHNLIDHDCDLDTWPGLDTPQALRAHLHMQIPDEDLVFSHGDLCDSNVFVDANGHLHFIDLGRGGIADRWLDIAFACRNLGEEVDDKAVEMLLSNLGISDRTGRRRYFEQLDELF